MNIMQKDTIQKMRSEGYSYSEIANALTISVNTIKSFCQRNKIKAPEPAIQAKNDESKDIALCKCCGKNLVQIPKQKPKKFCTDKCRLDWWNKNKDKVNKQAIYKKTCIYCNKEFESYGNSKRKYCSHACYIEARFVKGGIENDKRTV